MALESGSCHVMRISFFVLGAVMALASAPAGAQDFTAGKTPAQLFASDCSGCHRSPGSVARSRDVRALADFLREHYTTKSETAGLLAAYVSGFASGADARNRGGAAMAPANAATGERSQGDRSLGERRKRRDSDATATGDDARTNVTPVEEPAGRRRRATSVSGENAAAGERAQGERSVGERRKRRDGDATAAGEDARTNVTPVEEPAGRRRRATSLSGENAAAGERAQGERSVGERRKRRDGNATAAGEDARTNVTPVEEPAGRRRRTINVSGEGEKRRVRRDEDAPRPPASIAGTPAPKSAAASGTRAPSDATDPISRLRTYLSSGQSAESTASEAARMTSSKPRKRRSGSEGAEPAPAVAPEADKSTGGAPPAAETR